MDTSTLPSFSLLLDGNWFEISPDDYIKPVDNNDVMCTFCLYQSHNINSSSNDEKYDGAVWLGRRFLMDYYTTFDQENAQVSFTRLDAGSRSAPVSGSTPTIEMPRGVSLIEHN